MKIFYQTLGIMEGICFLNLLIRLVVLIQVQCGMTECLPVEPVVDHYTFSPIEWIDEVKDDCSDALTLSKSLREIKSSK